MSSENSVVKSITDYLNSLPNTVIENIQGTAGNSGKPDLSGCCMGTAIRIEVKTADDGNTASKKQRMNLRRWAAAGAFCMIAYTVEDVKNAISVDYVTKGRTKIRLNYNYTMSYGRDMISEVMK